MVYGSGLGVNVDVGAGASVSVGVGSGVGVWVGVGTGAGVTVGVASGVGEAASSAVCVTEGVGAGSGVSVAFGAGTAVRVAVAESSEVGAGGESKLHVDSMAAATVQTRPVPTTVIRLLTCRPKLERRATKTIRTRPSRLADSADYSSNLDFDEEAIDAQSHRTPIVDLDKPGSAPVGSPPTLTRPARDTGPTDGHNWISAPQNPRLHQTRTGTGNGPIWPEKNVSLLTAAGWTPLFQSCGSGSSTTWTS